MSINSFYINIKEDSEIVRKIIKSPIYIENIIKVLKENKELININENYILDERYLKSLKKDKDFPNS
jgi:hypothetical protein